MFWVLIFFVYLGHCLASRSTAYFVLLTYLSLNLCYSDEQAEILKPLRYAEVV